ncbi:undecaprenyl-diphosphatase UppP [Candidatus Uhrbacteria bacterium]|nr:undecaprenyl-diphosphatase UppP [Candidatus Uhrbacteria bacterium]
MSFFQAAFLGLVEGLTEFLPVSSTGHLILTSRLLAIPQTEFLKTFEIAIQLGAILAVLALYWRRFLRSPEALKRVIAAFLPTAVLGLVFYKMVKTYLLSNDAVVVWSLAIGGLVMIVFERRRRPPVVPVAAIEAISYRQAAIIGLCQALAMIPGVSRSGATIIGGLALGIDRAVIVEFSFLLAVPTMAAAVGLDLLKSGGFAAADAGVLLVGFIASFAVALAAVRFFLRFVRHHDFSAFGAYRIAAALAYALIAK